MKLQWRLGALLPPNQRAVDFLAELPEGAWLDVQLHGKRSLPQNDKINAAYHDIAKSVDGWLYIDARRWCKLHVGVPILRRDSEDFRRLYDKAIKPHLSYEEKLELMDSLNITSTFNKAQGTEYIDNITHHWGAKGVYFEEAA